MSGFDLGLASRPGGLTHVIDKGLGPHAWEDVLETSGDYIDIVKLGWGTSYVTQNLAKKLDVLKEKPVERLMKEPPPPTHGKRKGGGS